MNKIHALAVSLTLAAALTGCAIASDDARSDIPKPGPEITQAPSGPPLEWHSQPACPTSHCAV